MPLDVLVAMTEGSLGYILQQSLLNQLRKRQIEALRRDGRHAGPRGRERPGVPEPDASRSARSSPARRPSGGATQLGLEGARRTPGAAGGASCPRPRPLTVIQRHMIRDAARQGTSSSPAAAAASRSRRKPDGQLRRASRR